MPMENFDNFKWLLFQKPISEERLPDENVLTEKEGNGYNFGFEEYYFVVHFYSQYIRPFGKDLILKKVNELENSFAKAWAIFAIARAPFAIQHDNEEFEERMEELGKKLGIPFEHVKSVFLPYMPFLTNYDYFKFAYDNLDKADYRYFYLLLIDYKGDDYPEDLTKHYPDYHSCRKQVECKFSKECMKRRECYYIYINGGNNYDHAKDMNDYQKNLTLDFLRFAPKELKDKAIVKLYESFRQINQTGLFDSKLCLSYDKVLYSDGKPLTGSFFLRWDKVDFYDGFYLIYHPSLSTRDSMPYRVKDEHSRRSFNEISKLFMKNLPPLRVQAKDGNIVKVLNKVNLDECVTLMEHKVMKPVSLKKGMSIKTKTERKEISSSEAKTLCKEFKSRFLDYLCTKQIDEYKVVCCIEHRCNSSGSMSDEYSFIFTVHETARMLYLAYENSIEARCTYLFPVPKERWQLCIDKIYEYFASNEINKRQQLASRKVYLNLPGGHDYQRIMHDNYLKWVDRIKYCAYR